MKGRKERLRKSFDRWVLLIASVGWVFNVPQIIEIIRKETAAGVSLLTWTLYLLFDITWLAYGIVHKKPALILSYSLFLLTSLTVVVLTIIYS